MAKTKKKKSTKKPPRKSAKKKSTAKKSVKKKTKKKVTKKKKPAAAKKKAKKKTTGVKKKKKSAPRVKKSATPKKTSQKPASSTHPLLGSPLPQMTLLNQKDEWIDLAQVSHENSKVVLYFYPKDDTPGCTKEACDFRDNLNRLQNQGLRILGVSPDSTESHRKFIEKYGLTFDLLSDTHHALAEAMNVWKEKTFMGKTYMGVERSTFLLVNGVIQKAWQPVKVEGHVDDVLASAEA